MLFWPKRSHRRRAIASVAIDGSKFKAVNNRDRNFTRAKVERRRAQLEQSVARYLSQLDSADRQEPSVALAAKTTRLKEKLVKLAAEMRRLDGIEAQMLSAPGIRFLSRLNGWPARSPADASPILADACARLGADVDVG